jgi:hypothetical protein
MAYLKLMSWNSVENEGNSANLSQGNMAETLPGFFMSASITLLATAALTYLVLSIITV